MAEAKARPFMLNFICTFQVQSIDEAAKHSSPPQKPAFALQLMRCCLGPKTFSTSSQAGSRLGRQANEIASGWAGWIVNIDRSSADVYSSCPTNRRHQKEQY